MEIEHFIAFNFALVVAFASPGPALLYAMRTSIASGRMAGIATGAGLAFAASVWTLMALLGLDGLFKLFPWAYMTFKVVGALYLLYVAWSTWRNAHGEIGEVPRPNARAFVGGALVNLANPKAVLFAGAVLVVIFPPELSALSKSVIAGNQFVVEVIGYTAVSLILSSGPVSRQYLRAKPILDRAAALVLGALGIRLITDR